MQPYTLRPITLVNFPIVAVSADSHAGPKQACEARLRYPTAKVIPCPERHG